jgi:peptidoglycan/LPS O-acetylase OafA/YrhL
MAGAMAIAGLFGGLTTGGGSDRPWTLIAAWAAGAGILVVAGASLLRERPPRQSLVLLVHLVFVIAITRVADYTDSEIVVFLWLIVLVALAGLAVVLGPGTREEVDSPFSAVSS